MNLSFSRQNKIRVGVIYGGKSGEHEVSLASAASVIAELDRQRYEIVPIGVDKTGRWFLNRVEEIYSPKSPLLKVQGKHSETLAIPQIEKNGENSYAHLLDVVFPVMHGPLYEDGTIQGVFELANIPYVGAGLLASAIAMDKELTKRLIKAAGIPTVEYLSFEKSYWDFNKPVCINSAIEQLGFPIFIKPARLGSSVGINKAKDRNELFCLIETAFQYDTKILLEKAVNGREIEIGILENTIYGREPLVSVIGEIYISSKYEFYSYDAKYHDEGLRLLIPAELEESQIHELEEIAKQVFQIVGCEGFARADFFLDRDSGKVLFNELNTIPGFTANSMFPKLWVASGMTYSAILSHLIELALQRHQRNMSIKRDWVR